LKEIERMPLSENRVRITYSRFNDNEKSLIISDEKYHIVESAFGERSEENTSTELIRTIFNLESHQLLEKIGDNN
jgi:hypothetical protein